MATDAIGPVRSTDSAPLDAAAAARTQAMHAGVPAFADLLQRKLAEPRAALSDIRAEIASIRNGGVFLPAAAAAPDTASGTTS